MFIKSSVGILFIISAKKCVTNYTRAQIMIILQSLCYKWNTFYGTHWFIIVSDDTTTGPASQPYKFSLHLSILGNHPTTFLPSIPRSPEQSLKNKTKQRGVHVCVCARMWAHMLIIPDSEYKLWIISSKGTWQWHIKMWNTWFMNFMNCHIHFSVEDSVTSNFQ